MFLFDTHVHSSEVSLCGRVPAEEMVKLYSEAGYSGFVMTDHFNRWSLEQQGCFTAEERVEKYLSGYRKAKAYGDSIGFDVLFGMELALDGACNEYLLYGITEAFLRANTELYANDLAGLRRIADENGFLVFQAHPFRPNMTRGLPALLDGVEGVNGNPRHNSHNHLTQQFAAEHSLLMSSGSDAHQPEDVGRGGLRTERRITSLEILIEVLKNGGAELIGKDA